MRRFLCGIASSEERQAIEHRLITDAPFAERLGAMDDELLLAYVRRELSDEIRKPLEECLRNSAARRHRLHETEALLGSLTALEAGAGRATPGGGRPGIIRRWLPIAMAASLVAALASAWFLAAGTNTSGPAPASDTRATGPTVTLALAAGVLRSDTAAQNVVVIPPGTDALRLVGDLAISVKTGSRVSGTIEPVGEPALVLDSTPTVVATTAGWRMEWTLPAAQVPAGDYVVKLSATTGDGGSEVLGEWFFSRTR